ncbi:hypothetical protein [Pseudonocardia humida]|uniref:Uncharacterized protein n=1 Tax=Pseudonocardia humida TaxID=2800819 RepID=A0ABT1ABX5_9PSEU|nr:hypothetical protein [Pseudonocardia humida]MCO1660426.1 hypothetical protein [Pseudonocardia humida]
MTVEGGPHEVRVRRTGGEPAGLDEVEDRLRAALAGPGAPRWLGQLVGGVPDLECDTLGAGSPGRLREAFHNSGRLLSILFAEQDRRLEPARSGRLVRMVVRTGRGGAFCLSVVPGQHVVGFAHDVGPDGVAAAGAAMIGLVDRLRADLGLRSQNPGGLAARRDAAHPAAAGDGPEGPAGADPPTTAGVTAGPLFDRAAALLDGAALQWVGHVRDEAVVFTADRFADRRLARHFRLMSAPARRRFYESFAAEVVPLTGRLDRLVRSPLGGPLDGLVLDLEQGALLVQRLGPREHLVGVTVDQERVAAAEEALAALTRSLRTGEGG